MGSKVRMSDIAEKLGVSTVTVSKALSGKDGVSEELRGRVFRAAAEMGYLPKNGAKHGLEGKTVGILISSQFLSQAQSFYWSMYERVLLCFRERDAFGLLESVELDDMRSLQMPRIMESGRIQALLVIGQLDTDYLKKVLSSGIPTVQLDACQLSAELDTVISDGYYGTYRMTNYLLDRGHTRIAYLGRVGATSSITDRYFGYCRALRERNISLREDWVISDRDDCGENQIELPDELPTAFVCNCDAAAYHLIRLLNNMGLRVPQDISLVGFDDFLFSNLAEPRITTYAVDMEGMARASVAQLIERMAHPEKRPDFRVVSGCLVEKESVLAIS